MATATNARSSSRRPRIAVDDTLWRELLARMAGGQSVRKVIDYTDPPEGYDHWPDRVAFWRYSKSTPERAREWEESIAMLAEAKVEDIVDRAENCPDDRDAAAAVTVGLKAVMWRAAHLDRARFGEWKQVEHSGERKSLQITVHAKPEDVLPGGSVPRLLNPAQPPELPKSEPASE